MTNVHRLFRFSDADPTAIARIDTWARAHEEDIRKLSATTLFPERIWKDAGARGLLGIGIPEAFGGVGGFWPEMTAACARLALKTGSLGLSLSVMIHLMISRFAVLRLGTDAQKATYLPDLATGRKTLCMAVSEPEGGAHPKTLSTTATKTASGWVLRGEKTLITNAPIADLFIVIAVTGETDGKKAFTGFLVERDAPGLFVSDLGPLPFFRPSPHGGVRLEDVEVPDTAVIGNVGQIFDQLVRPFRNVEDVLMMGPVTGALMALLAEAVSVLGGETSDAVSDAIGLFEARVTGAQAMAVEATRFSLPSRESEWLSRAFRDHATRMVEDIGGLLEDRPLPATGKALLSDLEMSGKIARNVTTLRQRKSGRALLGCALST